VVLVCLKYSVMSLSLSRVQQLVGEWHPLYSAMPRIKILTSFEIREVSPAGFKIVSHYRYVVLFAAWVSGHPFVGRRNEYQIKGGDALRLGSKGR